MKQKFRSMFIAPKGKYLLQIDLSQAESWVTAFEAKDENMKHALKNNILHESTAAVIHDSTIDKVSKDMRYVAKRINHGSNYGMGAQKQAETINLFSNEPPYLIVTVPQVKIWQDRWHGLYWRIREWHSEIREKIRLDRTLINTYGAKRVFYGQVPVGDSGNFWNECYSQIPQSTIAYHFTGMEHPYFQIKGGLKEIRKQISVPINMSHDSCILEVDKSIINEIAELAISLMKRPMIINGEEFTIPVDAEYGERNGELEKWKKVN
jgi:DNA polymerase-1